MVYIHFPSNLTEEELMLQAKYQKLKKKKKALQAHKAPKQEPEKPLIPKRPADARDAREVARKLLKSGAIQAIQRPLSKQDQTSFKRPKGQERKRVIPDTTVAQYQPFSSSHMDGFKPAESGVAETLHEPSRVESLYQLFATERDMAERGLVDKKSTTSESATATSTARSDKPRSTIYVSGPKLTEDFLREHFSAFGEIVNISMEIEKERGFITFLKSESVDRSIVEMHGKSTAGVPLKVTLANRQLKVDLINEASSSAAWSSIAANQSQKASNKDDRSIVRYDDFL